MERARAIAEMAHVGQTDKAGNPYVRHPERVATYVRLLTGGFSAKDQQHAVAAAWLHDVIEDTKVSYGMLREFDIPEPVIEAVRLLTRYPDVAPEVYYANIRENKIALVVKYADLVDNTDPQRLALLPPEQQQRLRAKYERASACLRIHPQRWWEVASDPMVLEEAMTRTSSLP